MIPAYNAGSYLEEALQSVLRQDPGPEDMQIAVVDDASSDVDVAALVARIGGARVEYHRQPENVGSVRNFNTCVELSRGQYVHLLHADDRVLDGYYAAMTALFERHPEVGACFCGVRYIDEEGKPPGHGEPTYASSEGVLQDWLQTIATASRIQHVAISIKRSVYEAVGGYFGVTYGEDWEMHVRIASRYPMAYTPKTLADYRLHKDSMSRGKIRSGSNLEDMAWVISTIQNYLPAGQRDSLRQQAEKECARLGLHYARQLWRFHRDREGAERQIRGALRLCSDDDTRRTALEVRDFMSEPGMAPNV